MGLCADRAAGNRSEEPAFSGGVRLLGGGQADQCAQAMLGGHPDAEFRQGLVGRQDG